MGMTKGPDQSDISVTVSNENPSVCESEINSKEDIKHSGVFRAQSVTTIARSKDTNTAVTYSNVVAYSSPGTVQLVDTNTFVSQPSVSVSQNLTRPPPPSSHTPNLLQALQQSSQQVQLQQHSSTQHNHQSHLQHQAAHKQLSQPPSSLQLVQPHTTAKSLNQHKAIQHLNVPTQVTQNQSTQQHGILHNLLLSLGAQSQHSHQQPQQTSPKPIDTENLHSSPIPQQVNPILDPVQVGLRASTSSTAPVAVRQQSQLVKKLLIRNLFLLQQQQLQQQKQQQEVQQQPPQKHQPVLLTQQKLPQKKTVPTHTVQYEEANYPVHAGIVEVSVPLENLPPPYHSLQCVPEIPELGADQSSESGDLSPMRLGTAESSIPVGKMESRFISNLDRIINTCGDMPYSTDFLDASIYASSPNSLYMYDQEKIDMQSTLASTCTSADTSGITDDFELKSQYEISQDLSSNLPVCVTTIGDGGTFSMNYDGGGQMWGDGVKQSKEDVMIKSEITSTASTPTLAELNFNMDLLEDIETVISVDMNNTPGHTTRDTPLVIKQETETVYNKEHGISTSTKTTTSAATYTKLLPVQTIPDSKTLVKTEPFDYDNKQTDQIVHLLQTMHKAKQDSGRLQSSQIPLSTIKQLDLSDACTLRHLLINEQPNTTVRAPRKRTVSESATLKSASRKRSYPSAGLESMDRKWEEIKQFIHMDTPTEEAAPPTSRPSPIKRERKRYDSECSAITLTSNEDEDSDSDRDIDYDSDSDLEDGHDIGSLNPAESLIGEKDKQYFWQYNVQSKGPKGTRAHFDMEEDPHVLNDFEDPVFDPTNSNLAGVGVSIKHGGKARKGDGNDIVPSPKKLCQIGLQLRKINRQINDFLPVSELPSSARNKSRKEKNKLASRACRLKKKAQHEANKVKLHGLEVEHRQLLTVIRLMRKKLMERMRTKVKKEKQMSMTETLEQLISEHLKIMIAGNTTEYVNKVVHTVEGGDVTGGLKVQTTRSYPKELHN